MLAVKVNVDPYLKFSSIALSLHIIFHSEHAIHCAFCAVFTLSLLLQSWFEHDVGFFFRVGDFSHTWKLLSQCVRGRDKLDTFGLKYIHVNLRTYKHPQNTSHHTGQFMTQLLYMHACMLVFVCVCDWPAAVEPGVQVGCVKSAGIRPVSSASFPDSVAQTPLCCLEEHAPLS